jgi:hypothetical protein
VTHIKANEKTNRLSVEKLQAKKLLGTSRRGQACTRNIKMGLKEREWKGVD